MIPHTHWKVQTREPHLSQTEGGTRTPTGFPNTPLKKFVPTLHVASTRLIRFFANPQASILTAMSEVIHCPLAHSAEDVRPLHQLCREGLLYDIECWIANGKPLQLTPEADPKGTRPKTALQIAPETGQHSLTTLLLRNGYRLDLERYSPLDLAPVPTLGPLRPSSRLGRRSQKRRRLHSARDLQFRFL